MAQLADFLSRIPSGIDIPVLYETGLQGRYDFKLHFAPPSSGREGAGDTPGQPSDSGVSICDAMQQQLGLKLKPARRPLEFLVVDRADRTPTAN